ncbi:MAG: AMP-dependent synthetase/ligase [Spirochaetia bacterium]
MKKTLLTLIEENTKRCADNPYAFRKVGENWIPTSYIQMEKNARYLASVFIEKNMKKDTRIAILAEGSPEWICAEFGAIYSQVISVPLSIKLTQEEILFRLEHSQSSVVAVSEFTASKFFQIGKKTHALPILWLDNDKNAAFALAREYDYPLEKITFIDEAISHGKDLYENHGYEAKINAILEKIEEDDCVTISYSSGTTGNPKGVMLSHKNYYTNTTAATQLIDIPYGKTKTLLILPCDHAFGHTVGIYITLGTGGQLYFVDAQGGPSRMVHNIPTNLVEVQPWYILAVPALLSNFMKKVWGTIRQRGAVIEKMFTMAVNAGIEMIGDGFHRVSLWTKFKNFGPWFFFGKLLIFPKVRKSLPFKFAISGAALCDRKIQEFFGAIGIPIYQGYGMSEASPIISCNLTTKGDYKIGTAGRLFPGLQCRILRPDGSLAETGEIGEVSVQGESIMQGYFNNPDETTNVIRDGWLYTGDMGLVDENGFLSIVGREKALLISKDGEKHNPEEMEEAICVGSHELVNQCLLYCDHNAYVSALIYLEEERLKELVAQQPLPVNLHILNTVIEKEIFAFKNDPSYKGRFPHVWIPNTYHFVQAPFPTNSTMKIVRYKAFEQCQKEISMLYSVPGNKPNHPGNIDYLNAKLREWNIQSIY